MTFKELKNICRKGNEESFIIDKLILRRISVFFSYIFIKLGFKADFVTLLSFFSIIFSCAGFFFLKNFYILIGGIFLFTYIFLDTVDGEIARYEIKAGLKKPSFSGLYFDLLIHSFSMNLVFCFIGLGLFRITGEMYFIIFGVISCFGASNFSNSTANFVFIQKLAAEKKIIENESIHDYIKELGGGKYTLANNKSITAILKRLITELIVFPGPIYIFSVISVIDYFISNEKYEYILLKCFLILYTVFYILNIIRKSFYHYKKLKSVR